MDGTSPINKYGLNRLKIVSSGGVWRCGVASSSCYHSVSYANFTDWWSRPRLASSPRHSVAACGAPHGVAEERGSVSYINGVDLQSHIDWGTPRGCIAVREGGSVAPETSVPLPKKPTFSGCRGRHPAPPAQRWVLEFTPAHGYNHCKNRYELRVGIFTIYWGAGMA
jgi:hypothetical protein